MARIGINYEQVAATADALVSRGHKPTINAIRDEIKTGSPNTILAHLQKWRDAQPITQKAVRTAPESLMVAINTMLEQAEAAGRSEVESKLVQMKEELDTLSVELEQAEVTCDNVNQELSVVGQEKDKALSDVIAHQSTINSLESQLHAQSKINTVLSQELENLRVELAKSQLKSEAVDELKAEVLELRSRANYADVLQAKLDAANEKTQLQASQIEQLTHTVEANNLRSNRLLLARTRLV